MKAPLCALKKESSQSRGSSTGYSRNKGQFATINSIFHNLAPIGVAKDVFDQ